MVSQSTSDLVTAAELRDANERLRWVLSTITEAHVVYSRDWRVLAINPVAESSIFKRPASELLGKIIWQEYPEARDTDVYGHYARAFEGNHPVHFETLSLVANRWFEVHAYPRGDRLEVYLRDITDRKLAEQALREAEIQASRRATELTTVFDTITFPVIEFDVHGAPVGVNAAGRAVLGLEPETLDSEQWVELIIHDRGARHLDGNPLTPDELPVSRALLGEAVQRQVMVVRDARGREGIYEASASPLRENGQIVGAVVAWHDVTTLKLAEQELRESEEQLRLAQASAKLGTWDWKPKLNKLTFSPELHHLYGLTPGTIKTYQDWRKLAHPDDIERVEAERDQAIEHDQSFNLEFRVLHSSGEIRWINAQGGAYRDASGAVERVLGVNSDITERKRAEHAARANDARYRAFFENLREAVSVYEVVRDRHGCIVNWIIRELNEPFVQALGVPRKDMLDRLVTDAFGPDRAAEYMEQWSRVLSTGETEAYERTVAGRYYHISAFPIDANTIAATALDVTERHVREAHIAQLSRLYAVLSKVNECIVRTHNELELHREVCRIVAEQGDFPLVWVGLVRDRQVMPVASFGQCSNYVDEIRVEIEGELGKGPTGTCIREARVVINDDFADNPTTAPWRTSALRFGLRSSAAFPLWLQGNIVGALTLYGSEPHALDDEQIKLLSALSADVSYALGALHQERLRTDAEQALIASEQSLRDADLRKNEFLAMLSHELRNPLTPISTSLFILDRAVAGGEQANRAKAVIARQFGQLTRLVDDLLDITRISRGKFSLRRVRFDLVQMVVRSAEDHRTLFVDAGITFDVSTGARPLWVDGDEARMAQVVGNLLANSRKFTPSGGTVLLEVEEDVPNDMAILRVRDTGAGISPTTLPKLFDPFFQADESLERSKGGLGLGLALVKGIVEMHGGLVEATSDGLGTGAEFVLRIPAELRELELQRVQKTSSRPPSRRILVIEDNVDAAESLRDALEFGGHQVQVAHEGVGGLNKAREFKPHVVLCDIGLPGMTGYDVARAFRGDPLLGSAHLVALTGYALPDDQRRAQEAGFDQHLAKPPRLEEIEELLANLASLSD